MIEPWEIPQKFTGEPGPWRWSDNAIRSRTLATVPIYLKRWLSGLNSGDKQPLRLHSRIRATVMLERSGNSPPWQRVRMVRWDCWRHPEADGLIRRSKRPSLKIVKKKDDLHSKELLFRRSVAQESGLGATQIESDYIEPFLKQHVQNSISARL